MTFARRLLRLAPTTALVLILVAAPLPSSAKHGAGVVTDGHYQCYKGYLNLAFDFVGRMPAGSNFYTVTSGHATQIGAYCSGFGLSMTGDTPSGSFQWSCAGNFGSIVGPYVFRGTCVTIGYPGSFRIQIFIELTTDDGSEPYPVYSIVGVYHAATSLI